MIKPVASTHVLVRLLAVVVAAALPLALAACSNDSPTVIADGLTAPRGLTLTAGGEVLLAEGGAGRILRLSDDAPPVEVVAMLPVSLDAGPGGNTAAGVSAVVEWPDPDQPDRLAFIVGEFKGDRFARLYSVVPGEEPHGITPPSEPLEPGGLVNPYDLVVLNGDFIVSDPGANAIVRVTPAGGISVYARFPDLEGLVDDRSVEVVPTGLALSDDGTIYVASLTGYPYPRGAASVYRLVDANHDGDALDPGEVEVAATGFSTATDVALAPDGSLLVTEYSADMLALIEEHGGVDRTEEVPGRLVRWRNGEVEVLARTVSATSVLIDGDRILVSEEFPGRVIAVGLPGHAP